MWEYLTTFILLPITIKPFSFWVKFVDQLYKSVPVEQNVIDHFVIDVYKGASWECLNILCSYILSIQYRYIYIILCDINNNSIIIFITDMWHQCRMQHLYNTASIPDSSKVLDSFYQICFYSRLWQASHMHHTRWCRFMWIIKFFLQHRNKWCISKHWRVR